MKKILVFVISILFLASCSGINKTKKESKTKNKSVSISTSNVSINTTTKKENVTTSKVTTSSLKGDEYEIEYILDGGVASNPTLYKTSQESFKLNEPFKLDYEFIGWTTNNISEPVKDMIIEKGTTGKLVFTANYRQIPVDYDSLKIVTFADVQLTEKNLGNTVNAHITLKNHLKYAKSINADVLFMVGDIVNNAIEDYYKLFDATLKEVYGTDESLYPEFVYLMGNHEWWDSGEKDTANAVTLFKKYARIESDSLVKTSSSTYYLNSSETIPSYYKVIKGVPFIAINAKNSSGKLDGTQEKELKEWLDDASKLNSVKNGGPIFVGYHYPIIDSTYDGQGASDSTHYVHEILKNYPNVIIFTGDTHYPSINERTINQNYYTSINIGSSSYSRIVNSSATSSKNYTNVPYGGSKNSDIIKGECLFKYEYTPNLMVLDFDKNTLTTKINRYFSADNAEDVKHLGIEWEIERHPSIDDFKYTSDRYENIEWANTLYHKDGVEFDSTAKVEYKVDGTNMFVVFDDTIEFNYTEHYKIFVNTNEYEKVFDYVSNYYKADDYPHKYHIVLNNIPVGDSYKVTIKAYDFFDNESINFLESYEESSSIDFPNHIDEILYDSYSDISKRINYDVKALNSNSSNEYYYKGETDYKYGAILCRVLNDNLTSSAIKELSYKEGNHPVLSFKVKNNNDYKLIFGLSVVTKTSGVEKWLSDFNQNTQVTVNANSEWIVVSYDLYELYGLTSIASISNLTIKVRPENGIMGGKTWEMSLFIDDVDIE